MKKLLSLLAILGLLAFVATPIYAQEEDVALEDEGIAAEAEDIEFDAEASEAEMPAIDDGTLYAEDAYALEATDEDTIEGEADFDDAEYALTEEDLENMFGSFSDEQKEAVAWVWVLWVFAGLGMAGIIIAIIWGILAIIAMWKIFTKAGEAGWKSIIPIYNVYIMYKIVGMKNWFWYTIIAAFCLGFIAGLLWEGSSAYGILMCISCLFSGIVAIVAAYKLPRKFGWGVFASILYVLFTAICILILGFGNYKYEGKEEKTVVEA